MKNIFKWILFIPLNVTIYFISYFILYIGVTFLFNKLSGLAWYSFVPAIFLSFIILILISSGVYSGFYFGLSMKPNKILLWLLSAYFIFKTLSSIPGFCSAPALVELNVADDSLPCWAFIIFQLYFIIILITPTIILSKNLKK